jgi:uncharacterized damage-inducible protein DinB
MTFYGGKHMADSFRTVRKNTLAIAEEIPAEQFDFKATPDVRSVGALLAHIAVLTRWPMKVHSTGMTFEEFAEFAAARAQAGEHEAALRTKEEILAALRKGGEDFASFLEALDDDTLAQTVGFPPPVQPSSKSRFEMLLGVKEHEMHHRGQLMLVQRLLGMVPPLTRQREAMRAQAPARA